MSAGSALIPLFAHKAWCNAGMIAAFRGAPPEADPRQMAVALYTLDHTSIVDQIFRARLTGEKTAFTAVVATARPDLGQLAATMDATDAWYLAYARGVDSAELHQVVEFTFVADGEPGRMTRAEILAHVIAHGASHRGAIGQMLQAAGATGPPDMVTTFRRPSSPMTEDAFQGARER